jgi:hypothetical protein
MLSLCLTKYYAMKMYWGVDVQIHVFFIPAPVGGGWSASRPCRFTSGTHRIGGWVGGPQSQSEWYEEMKILDSMRTQLRPLGRPARSQSPPWLIRWRTPRCAVLSCPLSYPLPRLVHCSFLYFAPIHQWRICYGRFYCLKHVWSEITASEGNELIRRIWFPTHVENKSPVKWARDTQAAIVLLECDPV